MKEARMFLLFVSLIVMMQISTCSARECSRSYESMERTCYHHQTNHPNATEHDVKLTIQCMVRCMEAAFHASDMSAAKTCYTHHFPIFRDFYLRPKLGNFEKCIAAADRSNCTETIFYKYFGSMESMNWQIAPLFIEPWLTHPDLPMKEFSCIDYPYYYSLRLLKKLSEDSASDPNVANPIKDLDGKRPMEYLANELQRYCDKNGVTAEAAHLCFYNYFHDFAINIYQGATAEDRDSTTIDLNGNVFKLSLNMLMFKVGETFGKRAEEVKSEVLSTFKNYVDHFLNKVESNARKSEYRSEQLFSDVSLVKEFCSGEVSIFSLQRADTTKASPDHLKKIGCLTFEMQGQLLAFSHKRGKVNVITVNPSVNYKTYLQELREERILQLLLALTVDFQRAQDQSEAQLNTKFNQLKQYFDKINSFNRQIAEADVAYVRGVIKFYREKTKEFTEVFSTNVKSILDQAYIVAALNIAFDFAKLALTIAQAMNPMDFLINGGSFTDIMEATSDLAESAVQMTQINKNYEVWGVLFQNVSKISEGYRKNAKFTTAMTNIVNDMIKEEGESSSGDIEESRNTYLKLYNDYTPQVKRVDLEVIELGIDGVIESTCEVLSTVKGASGLNVEAAVIDRSCPKARESAKKLMTALLEIYDLQFELIDCITEFMRASVAMEAAESMGSMSVKSVLSTTTTDEQKAEYRAGILVAHLTYQNQKASSVEKYCDYLRYQEGGSIPYVCKVKPISITALLSYIPKTCTLQDGYFDVPTTDKFPAPKGSIYLPDLYAGRQVTLQIPDYKWLVDNRWIERGQEHKAIKVQSFQPILPTVSRKKQQVLVKITAAGNNTLRPNGIHYNLIQPMTQTAVYQEGYTYKPCAGQEYDNPYSLCPSDQLPPVCIDTDDAKDLEWGKVNPSIFSLWRFKAHAYKRSRRALPKPKTPLFLKVKATLCVHFKVDTLFKRSSIFSESTCCARNQFWSATHGACANCPASSSKKLKGYYCQ